MIYYYSRTFKLEAATEGSAGYDIHCDNDVSRDIAPIYSEESGFRAMPGTRILVSTNLYVAMPHGMHGMVCSRSGLALHNGVVVLNAPGIIDSDYRGEIKVTLANFGNQPWTAQPGMRIAQLLFVSHYGSLGFAAEPGQPTYAINEENSMLERIATFDEFRTRFINTTRGTSGHGSTGR